MPTPTPHSRTHSSTEGSIGEAAANTFKRLSGSATACSKLATNRSANDQAGQWCVKKTGTTLLQINVLQRRSLKNIALQKRRMPIPQNSIDITTTKRKKWEAPGTRMHKTNKASNASTACLPQQSFSVTVSLQAKSAGCKINKNILILHLRNQKVPSWNNI